MTERAEPIVVGVDGSTSSIHSLRWAAGEAALRGSGLRVVHAHASPDARERIPAETILDDAIALARAWQPGVAATRVIRGGRPVPALCAESEHAQLVVLGNRGRGGIAGLLLGSVSTQVAAHARCPVLVVRGEKVPASPAPSPLSRHPIVVGVDGSPASELAAGLAFEEASLRGAELVAIRAWRPPARPWRSDLRPPELDVDEMETAERHLLAASVATWRSKFPDVAVELRPVPGRAGDALVSASPHARLIVVGAHGHDGFSGLLLGSAGDQVLLHARCPVLVAR